MYADSEVKIKSWPYGEDDQCQFFLKPHGTDGEFLIVTGDSQRVRGQMLYLDADATEKFYPAWGDSQCLFKWITHPHIPSTGWIVSGSQSRAPDRMIYLHQEGEFGSWPYWQDNLCTWTILPAAKAEIRNLSFSTSSAMISKVPDCTLTETHSNISEVEQSSEFTFTYSQVESYSFEMTHGWKVKAEIKSKLNALIFSGELRVGLEVDGSYTIRQSKSSTTTRSIKYPVRVPAKSIVTGTMIYTKAVIDVPWEGELYWCDYGISHKISGTWRGVTSDKVYITTKQLPLP